MIRMTGLIIRGPSIESTLLGETASKFSMENCCVGYVRDGTTCKPTVYIIVPIHTYALTRVSHAYTTYRVFLDESRGERSCIILRE